MTGPRPPERDVTQLPEFHRALAERTLDVITVLDGAGTIVYQSPSVERVFGYVPTEMLARPVLDYIHEDDQARTLAALGSVLSGASETETVEIRFRHRDGSWRYIEGVGLTLELDSRPHVLVNTRDVTERQEMMRALARSNELLTKSFQSARNILSITHAETGVFVDVNEAWEQTAGIERSKAIGRTAFELGIWGTEENRNRVLDAVRAGGGRLRDFEVTTYGRKGPVQLIVNVETLEIGEAPLILMTGTDVTEARITEEQLRQAQKMEAVGQLTGGVAHDFNNLLGIIMGNAELLAEAAAGQPELEESIQPILEATRRGATLTQQLLAFSRRQILAPRAVDLQDVLTRMTPILRTTLGPAVRIVVDAPGDLNPCMVDPAQLENALLNLVLNARDAMAGDGTLRITFANRLLAEGARDRAFEATPGEYVSICIEDDGRGMDAATVQKAFEPFFTTKEPGRGTGLGLSMVFGFVRQSGGQVEIHSEVGAGTRVTLLLPRAEAHAPPADPATLVEAGPRAEGETVLVLEDEADLLALLRAFLEDLGYQVIPAQTEREVDAALEAGTPFDLLITDVLLAGPRRGPEVARRVLACRPDTRVLYISGYPADELEAGALPGACGSLLTKPFSREELARRVREAL
ncbi:MAG: PAS domain S-box protein [Pseudomonadales bacterium]|jgi:PAS domain S-box-containing protein|nr:PAS domain S-box protein [Pseudomonadales bacterium]